MTVRRIPPLRLFLVLLIHGAGGALPAQAETKPAPEQIPGVTRVEAEELLELVRRERRLVLVDSRIAIDRRHGYIEGSISLPDVDTRCETLARVIPGKNHPALFYCNGVRCGRSVVAIGIAKNCGYRKLYWYRGGFEDWKRKGFPYLKQ
jgi:rhodanese-related sulfurtransferase